MLRDNIVILNSTKQDLSPEQKLCLSMLVLAIQDLHLEKFFSGLKDEYVLPKSKPVVRPHAVSALTWVHKKNSAYSHSFDCCCLVLKLNPEFLRKKIYKCLDIINDRIINDVYKDFFCL